MEIFQGKSILDEIAIGTILYYQKEERRIIQYKPKDPQEEWGRLLVARDQALEQLRSLYDKACREVGEAHAAVFEVHMMMLDDGDDYMRSVSDKILNQQVNAEYAVISSGDYFANMFEEMEGEYFKARAVDMLDISNRLLRILTGGSNDMELDGPVILAAEDLAPSETVQLDKTKLLAFVTKKGSLDSHTAILARTMNIPALIGIDISRNWNGKTVIVDGSTGTLYVDPDEETLQKMRALQDRKMHKKALLQQLKGKEDITKDGRKIRLYANIGSVSDVEMVLQNDAAGIGLFRSEFLYLEKDYFPTEEEQFQVYKSVVETMKGRKVIIRTLDIGADKQVDYFNLGKEDNPAMGYRAIRICLTQPQIFKTQLRAIYRASAFGNIAILYPMIISVEEIRKIKEIVTEVKEDLHRQGIAFREIEQGIMIETPAAVMMSDELAKEVDFFSIGTNDLTQYTLAVDRQNVKLEDFYNPYHPAIMRMIKQVIAHGHAQNCWVGICGELAADMSLTREFLDMGIDELSVSPGFVLPIRKLIREYEKKSDILQA